MDWTALATIGSSLLEAKFSKDQARRQMRFQEGMSSTAYQRAMEDMRKAGLNPILAAKLGGASTPSGAMAKTPDLSGATAKGLSISNLKKLQDAQVEQSEATAEKIAAEKKKIEVETQILKDTEGSIIGRNVNFISRLLGDAWDDLDLSQKVTKVVDQIIEQNSGLFEFTGKQLTRIKNKLNYAVRQYLTGGKATRDVYQDEILRSLNK